MRCVCLNELSRSQGSAAPSANLPNLSLALAGGMILGNKAMMVHYRSPKHNWIFRPPYTIIFSIPNLFSPLRRLWLRRSGDAKKDDLERRSIQWGPFTSESYDNMNGVLSVNVQNFTRKLRITVRATEVSHDVIPGQVPSNVIIISHLPLVHGFPCTVLFREGTLRQHTRRSLRSWIFQHIRERGHLVPGHSLKATSYRTPLWNLEVHIGTNRSSDHLD